MLEERGGEHLPRIIGNILFQDAPHGAGGAHQVASGGPPGWGTGSGLEQAHQLLSQSW